MFLVQKEVANRLAAKPGSKTYGALSVGVQAVARVERLFLVRAGSFRPPPEVESAVVRLTPLGEPIVNPSEVAGLRSFVTKLFGQRRKQILRSLQSAIGLEKAAAASAAAAIGADPADRLHARHPDEPSEAVLDAVLEEFGAFGAAPHDDRTILILRT